MHFRCTAQPQPTLWYKAIFDDSYECHCFHSCPFLSCTVANLQQASTFTWTPSSSLVLQFCSLTKQKEKKKSSILTLMLTCLCYLQALTKDSRSKLRVNIPLFFSKLHFSECRLKLKCPSLSFRLCCKKGCHLCR